MSSPNGYAEVAKEAICSALYGLAWTRFLGERPDIVTGWDTAWFRLSRDPTIEVSARQDPKQVMVSVTNDTEDTVMVSIEWLNLSGDTVIRGGQRIRIIADPDQPQATEHATEAAVLRVLEIFSDVLNGEGVAGPLEENAPESEAGDPDDPDDMAASDEEVGRE